MTPLILGLYVEGNMDKWFLPVLVQRTAQRIVDTSARYEIEVMSVQVVNDDLERKPPKYIDRVLEAARFTDGYHALILHRDADSSSCDKARKNYIAPACKKVEQAVAQGERVCNNLVPLIPIRTIEAWMLTDPEALREVIGTRASIESFGLPNHAHEVEAIGNPKARLNQLLERHKQELKPLCEALSETIRLERLAQAPAFQQFEQELTDALRKLRMAE